MTNALGTVRQTSLLTVTNGVVCCVVGTSCVWVLIIYHTRRNIRREEPPRQGQWVRQHHTQHPLLERRKVWRQQHLIIGGGAVQEPAIRSAPKNSSEWSNLVVLCGGASVGIRAVMRFSTVEGPGVTIPISQYPLYSSNLAEYEMEQVGYCNYESEDCAMEISEREGSLNEVRKTCEVRALVVINPGNPNGQVLTGENIVKFCHRERLLLFADQVYQHNIYAEGSSFHSFKKVRMEMGDPYNKM